MARRYPPRGQSAEDRLRWYGWTERLVVSELGPCWEWNGVRDRNGYGKVWQNSKQKLTHRLAYGAWVGCLEAQKIVCHRCDNPPCINPKHLYLGTPLDNAMDRDLRERCWSKLTHANVRAIRQSWASGEVTKTQLADQFGVSRPLIEMILSRKAWRNVD